MSSLPQHELSDLVSSIVAHTIEQLPVNRLSYTIDQAAQAVGLPRNTLRDRVSSGEIPAQMRAGKWLILHEDLIRWLRG